MFKKVFKTISLILALIVITGCGVNPVEKSISEAISRDVLFDFKDVTGDGYGPGYYSYPVDYELYKKGTFDIIQFSIEDAEDFLYFKFKFREEIHRDNSRFGRWDQIMIDVYIDKDQQPYSGENNTLPGREVFFDSKSCWENVVVVAPIESESFKRYLEYDSTDTWTKLHFKRGSIVIPDFYTVGYNTITAKIPKYVIGTPKKWWGYQVLVTGFADYNLSKDNIYAANVKAVADTLNFGGGSSYYGNSNVLDILDGSQDIDQKKSLSEYSLNANKRKAVYPKLSMIYASRIQGKTKMDVKIDRKAEDFLERTKKKEEDSVSNKDIHLENMKKILAAALKYKKDVGDDENITLFDLMLSGYLSDDIDTPDKCSYNIVDEKNSKLRVECNNINGERLLVIVE